MFLKTTFRCFMIVLICMIVGLAQSAAQGFSFKANYSNVTWSGNYNPISVQLSDSSYLCLTNFHLAKISKAGVAQWTRNYSISPTRVAATNDGGCIIGGTNLARLNANGAPVWSKTWTWSPNSSDLVATTDGEFMARSGNELIKFDIDGNVTWTAAINGWTPGQMIAAMNGGVLFAGVDGSRMRIAHVENDGTVAFDVETQSTGFGTFTGVTQQSTGAIWAASHKHSWGQWTDYNTTLYMVQLDSNGASIGSAGYSHYGEMYYKYNALGRTGSDFLVLGGEEIDYTGSTTFADESGQLVIIDPTGNNFMHEIWPCRQPNKAMPTYDGGCVIGVYDEISYCGGPVAPEFHKLNAVNTLCSYSLSSFYGSSGNAYQMNSNTNTLSSVALTLPAAANTTFSSGPLPAETCNTYGALNCSPPANLNTSNITQTSASLSWSVSSNTGNRTVELKHPNGIVTPYQVWATNAHGLSGLAPYTTYQWRVVAPCANSNIVHSPWTTFTTDAPPCVAPSNLSVDDEFTDGASISWDPVPWANSYQLRLHQGGPTVALNTVSHPTTSFTFTGLAPDTSWHIQVRSNCVNGWSTSTAVDSFTTQPSVCIIPSNLAVNTVSNHTASVSWQGDPTAVGYLVESTDLHTHITTTDTVFGPISGFDIENLAFCTDHEWRVAMLCTPPNLLSQWSGLSTFTSGCITPKTVTAEGSNGLSDERGLYVFPVPASSQITVQLPATAGKVVQWRIYNGLGKSVQLQPETASKEAQWTIEVEKLPAGIYHCIAVTENGVLSSPFVVQH